MKIFIDTLDYDIIKKYYDMGILSGVTTNPTMMNRFNIKDDVEMVNKLRDIIGNNEIHIEAFGSNYLEILENSDRLLSTGKNLVFKIPFSEGGVEAANHLIKMGHKTNLHLIFSINQAIIASSINSTYICPLIGRLDDIGHSAYDNIKIMKKLPTKIMMSSIRHPQHVINALDLEVDAITIPPSVLEKMFEHPLTVNGINQFKIDLDNNEKN